MSGYNNHDNFNRYDSALDLSQSEQQHPTDYYDQEESQTISASSVAQYSAPWSQLNLRHDSDPFMPFVNYNCSSATHALDDVASFEAISQSLDDSFIPYVPGPRYYSPDVESPTNYSVPPSPSLPRPWAAASSAIASPTLVTSSHTDSNTIPCGLCKKVFTGTYRRGNLARHVKQKHKHIDAVSGPYTCTAEGCIRVFQRSDARLKHARSKHPELHLPPVQRRQGTEHYSKEKQGDSEPSNPNLTYVGHWLQAGQGLVDSHESTVQHLINPISGIEHLPLAATSVFQTLRSKLEPEAYALVCDSSFSRWESIVQQLNENGSEAYPVYAEVLHDIHAVVRAIDSSSTTLGGSKSHAGHDKGRSVPSSKAGSSLGPGGGITSQSDRVTKRSDRRHSNASESRKNTIAQIGTTNRKTQVVYVDCPIDKHHRMHGTTPPCHGCRVSVMAQVRGHLNPVRAGTHRGFPSFIAHCSRCEQDFIDRQLYDDHTRASCDFNPQIRGDILTSWVRLYLKLYPGALRVPSPWVNENTWLAESDLAPCRSPFLGRGQRRNIPPIPTTQAANSPPTHPGYDVALGHVLHDIVNPAIIHPPGASSPIPNPNRMSTTDLQRSLTRSPGCTNDQHWQNVLRSFRTHQRTLRQAAAYLTSDQIREMAQQSEMVYRLSSHFHYQQQQQQAQQSQGQLQSSFQLQPQPQHFDHSAMLPASSTSEGGPGVEHTLTMTPVRSRDSPLNGPVQYSTPSSSTQPSSAGNRTRSSLNYNSSITTPSSTQQHFDSYYLSPGSPLYLRRSSLPPGLSPDVLHPRPGLPSSLSLPENNGNPGLPYMEPSEPPTPNEEPGDPFYYNPQF